ncbi:SDR family oxidoreductase [Gordonia sp. ABSL11-1]|uniref:SDR family NAD(P)-dependent oxidoreductase n=1 Tax=Gordonia sp. ABSL11-1 TaxID=3053924 RepID=UPI0025741115|nr:SDR family oxidoreductase [Gordonia sp. ABSL11-1]MDL9945317.1 SDR family oxidoreductase [Gordonia sp. ABSL11-1]
MVQTLDHTQQTTIITGASSGIGDAFARALAARGSHLILVARRQDRLASLAGELSSRHHVRVEPIAADLSSPNAGVEVRAALTAAGLRPTSLINNAGFGTFGAFLDEDPDRLAQEIAVDVAAPVQLTAEFLPDLIDAGHGYLINVASMAAYTPTPRMAVYGAAKAFVLSFTESLSAELRHTGVRVFALSPGATSTEFNQVVGTEDATAGAAKRSPTQVVATGLAHLERRRPSASVIDGRTNRAAAVLSRLLPRQSVLNTMDRLTRPSGRD